MSIKLLIPVVVAAVALSSCVHHHAPHARYSNPVVVKQVVHRPVVKKEGVHKAARPHVAKPMAHKRPNNRPLAALDRSHKKR